MRVWSRHPIIGAGIALAIALVLTVALFSAPPWPLWPPGRPTSDIATIWITAFATIGTLLAVIAAVWNADEAARNADTAARIARESADREEQARHDAIRPVLTVRMWRVTVRFDNRNIRDEEMTHDWEAFLAEHGEDGSVRVALKNDGSHTAVSLRVLLERVADDPREPHYLQVSSEDARYRFNLPVGDNIVLRRKDPDIAVGSLWQLTCFYEDVLGWSWSARGLVVFGDEQGRAPDNKEATLVVQGPLLQDIPLGQPQCGRLPDDLPD